MKEKIKFGVPYYVDDLPNTEDASNGNGTVEEMSRNPITFLLGTLFLFLGFGLLLAAIAFFIFGFSSGTSSGSVIGLWVVLPPLVLIILVALGLGTFLRSI
ncbi:MAG: hypothetical protein IPN06_10210 [Burkholderiales bacterium]|nr:hypothetical protein [Burkholderiales bacterium]